MKKKRMRKRSLQSRRFSVPATCLVALACIMGVFVSSFVVDLIDRTILFRALVIGFILVALTMILLWRTHATILLWVCSFFLIGVMLGAAQLMLLAQDRDSASGDLVRYEFALEEDSRESTYGTQVVARISSPDQTGRRVLLFLNDKTRLYRGDVLVAETFLKAPGEEYQAYYDKRNISFSADIKSYEIHEDRSWLGVVYELRKRLLNIVGEGSDEQTLLRAILLGERAELFDAGFYHGIKVAGLAHLVAVSGAHLVIVTGFIAALLKKYYASPRVFVSVQTAFLLGYLVLVAFPVSCIRAAVMSSVVLFSSLPRRAPSGFTALGAAVLAMVVLDPSVIHQLSFQLSVTATLGIILFTPLFVDWYAAFWPKSPEFLRESICMTLGALIFSLPLSAAQFSTVPLLCPIANLIATPLLTALLMLGFIALLFCFPAPWLLVVLKLLASIACCFFAAFASIPFASVPVNFQVEVVFPLALAGAVLLWFWWPTPRRNRRRTIALTCSCALALCLVVLGLRFLPAGDRIVMLDVGQGDSFALQSGSKTVLVDTGKEPSLLYAALARHNIHHLDAIIITHPDDDHCGSLTELPGVVDVDQVLVADGLEEIEDAKVQGFLSEAQAVSGTKKLVEIKRGDSLTFGSFTLDVISPDHIEQAGGNEDSICFYLRSDNDHDGEQDWSALFCGDAEASVLASLEDEGLLEQVDIFKVGHHGSRKALTPEVAKTLSPKIALIGVGKNSYGHPSDEALSCLESVNAAVYRSDQSGDVECAFEGGSLRVTTQR